MQFWVGITDSDWFERLRELGPDEVNFWQPTERPPRRMEPGWPFLFKLHAPDNFIVGGGFFVRFTVLPCFLAWEAFGERNGTASLQELMARTARYRKSRPGPGGTIGCSILTEPFFFAREDWIPVPGDWPRHVQRGRTYDTETGSGGSLWQAVMERFARYRPGRSPDEIQEPRFGDAFLARARLGQGAFRTLVVDAYARRCAVSRERCLPALEAAHIKPHADSGPNRTSNGLLLRADIHRLFDDGYVTVDPDLRFVVSRRLREEFENGQVYHAHHGEQLKNLPERPQDRPSRTYLEWHNTHIFVE